MKEAGYKIRHCHSASGITSVDMRWRLQVANSFGPKTRRRFVDVLPRGEQGIRDGRKGTLTGSGRGVGTGGRASTGMGTRVGMRSRAGAGTGVGMGENGDKNRDGSGGEREPWNLRSGNRGGSEDARRRATPTSNQRP